jgi:hypothetical protein
VHRPTTPRPGPGRRSRRALTLAAVASLALLAASCSSSSGSDSSATTTSTAKSTTTSSSTGSTETTDATGGGDQADEIIWGGDGNNLDAYAPEPSADGSFEHQRVSETVETDPKNGRDINAQLCFMPPTKDGEQWLIAGEDTLQDAAVNPRTPGWGIFRVDGHKIGSLKVTQIGKLVPTFQPATDNPENYGCGVLPDGRVLTTDVGNQAGGSGDGQLIIWFPPLTGGAYPTFDDVSYCKIDIGLPTAQSILVRGNDIYVAASRAGVFKYTGPFPTSNDASGGCGKKDGTGAPMADSVHKTMFIKPGPHAMATPAGLADAPKDGFYVSSVFSGVINEYGPDGTFRRTILQPPAGEEIGAKPFSTGTPLGIGVGKDGSIYYADIGVIVTPGTVGPGDKTGSVRRIPFVDGEPQAPQTMAKDLDYPDGIGVWDPSAGAAPDGSKA